jgi:hypothetical protein
MTNAMVYLAVQDPAGAYIISWSAVKNGDKWQFAMAPSTGEVKPRASDFDSMSMSALATATSGRETPAFIPAPTGDTSAGATPTTTPAPTPESTPAPSGPKKVPTPAGPVTIPGSG